MKYFTSDLHHKHKNICAYTNRKLQVQPEEHDRWLVNIWNDTVLPSDTVYHLGDLSFATKYDVIAEFVSSLKGQKFLIKGNHDRTEFLDRLKADNLIQNWYDYKEIKLGDNKVVLFHFPISAWHQQHRGSWMLHGHCVDDATEILTEKGWKKYGEFSLDDSIYTYNTDKRYSELSRINEILSYQYTGDVYELKGKSVNFRVTDEHMIPYLHEDVYKKISAKNITPLGRYGIITSVENESQGVTLTPDELKLYICIAADGSIKKETNLCRIKVKKEHKKEYLRNLFSRLEVHYKSYDKAGYTSFNFYIPESLGDWNFKGLDEKLRAANREDACAIVEAYCNSDGHRQPNGVIIYSQKEQEIDLLQQVLVLNGFMSTKYSRNHGFGNKIQHQLSVTDNQTSLVLGARFAKSYVENEHFWCIKTDNKNFFIRREGKVSLTGNSHGSHKQSGKILDVGLDSAYNLTKDHKLISEIEVVSYMDNQDKAVNDGHTCREGE